MKRNAHIERRVFFLIVALFAVYAGIFIYKTSFLVDGERFFCLFDDAMVSMRYARNLVEGNGLVMNPGERVEGITNPLWTFWMAAVHLLPVSMQRISLVIQLTSALCLAACLFFVRALALRISGGSPAVSVAAVFLAAFYLPLINWSLQGMETGLLALAVAAAVLLAARSWDRDEVPTGALLLLGAATFVRIDMVVPFLAIWFFSAFSSPVRRRRTLVLGGIVLAGVLFVQTAARLAYYGDPLPNTYYLKMTGYPFFLRLARGVYVWWKFAWGLNPLLLAITVSAVALSYDRVKGLMASLIVSQSFYSIYVGGDAWEDWGGSNRYMAVVMPLFFVLTAWSFGQLRRVIGENRGNNTPEPGRFGSFVLRYHFAALIILCFLHANSNSGSLTLRGMAFLDLPPHIENNRDMVERAQLVRRVTGEDASIAVTWAGIIPYFSGRYTVDILGKTDTTIARLDMRRAAEDVNPLTHFLPGHLKYDYRYSLGECKPDAVLQFWGDINEANPFISPNYTRLQVMGKYVFYLRNNSPNVLWDTFMKEQ